MANQHHVHFIQYIFDEDGEEHLILNYRCELDFGPFIGMMIGFDKPFTEWEYQVEKVVWTTSSKPKFLCHMKNIKYSSNDVDPHWQSVHSFTEVQNYFEKIIDFSKELESLVTLSLSHYNFRDQHSAWD
jgi:hypothetical protein